MSVQPSSVITRTGVAVRVSEIQLQRAVVAQNAPHLAKYLNQFGDIHIWRFFQAKLRVDAAGTAPSADVSVRYVSRERPVGSLSSRTLVVGRLMVAPFIPSFPRRSPVVSQPPIRRRRDAAMHRLRRKSSEHFERVALTDDNAFAAKVRSWRLNGCAHTSTMPQPPRVRQITPWLAAARRATPDMQRSQSTRGLRNPRPRKSATPARPGAGTPRFALSSPAACWTAGWGVAYGDCGGQCRCGRRHWHRVASHPTRR